MVGELSADLAGSSSCKLPMMRSAPTSLLLATAASLADKLRSNLGAVVGIIVLYLFVGSLRGPSVKTKTSYKSFTARDLPPPAPREPSPFRVPLCAAPAWPGSALVEDMAHCPGPEWGAVYANYQADELIKVRVREKPTHRLSRSSPARGGSLRGRGGRVLCLTRSLHPKRSLSPYPAGH